VPAFRHGSGAALGDDRVNAHAMEVHRFLVDIYETNMTNT